MTNLPVSAVSLTSPHAGVGGIRGRRADSLVGSSDRQDLTSTVVPAHAMGAFVAAGIAVGVRAPARREAAAGMGASP